jgi:hypothetical protein
MITQSLTEEAETLSDEELADLAELHRGMVRASFGIYNTEEDVDALASALTRLAADKDFYRRQYRRLPNGDYEHTSFRFDPARSFSVKAEVDRLLDA